MPSIHPHIPHHWARIQQGRGKRRVQDLANRPLHRVCTCGPARRDRTTFDHLSKCHQSQCQLHTASLKTCGCEMIRKARPGVLILAYGHLEQASISQCAAKRCPPTHIFPSVKKKNASRQATVRPKRTKPRKPDTVASQPAICESALGDLRELG